MVDLLQSEDHRRLLDASDLSERAWIARYLSVHGERFGPDLSERSERPRILRLPRGATRYQPTVQHEHRERFGLRSVVDAMKALGTVRGIDTLVRPAAGRIAHCLGDIVSADRESAAPTQIRSLSS